MFLGYRLKKALKKSETYLSRQVLKGEYGLSSIREDNEPTFSNNKGHLFSVFFIQQALGSSMPEIIRSILVTRILSEKHNEMWGYSPRSHHKGNDDNPFIVDSDDTAFVIRALRGFDIYHSPKIFLEYLHQIVINGKEYPLFTTFKSSKAHRLADYSNHVNNFEIHAEVNANIYHCLLETDYEKYISEDFVATSQHEDGSWPSFFYPNPLFSSYHFVHLLVKLGENQETLEKGFKFVQEYLEKKQDKLDSLSLALGLNILMLSKHQTTQSTLKPLVLNALEKQERDGSWRSNEIIWEFVDQEELKWQAKDKNRIITTSLMLKALKTYLN